MPVFRCNACQGTYTDTIAGGTPYAHVCPQLPPDDAGEVRMRDGHRDENVAISKGGLITGIRSEGAGVSPVSHPRLREPQWISALQARVAAEEEEE